MGTRKRPRSKSSRSGSPQKKKVQVAPKKECKQDPQGDIPEEFKAAFEIYLGAEDGDLKAECRVCKEGCFISPTSLRNHSKKCKGTEKPLQTAHRGHFNWKEEGFCMKRGHCRHCGTKMNIGSNHQELMFHLIECQSHKLNGTWYKTGTILCPGCKAEMPKPDLVAHHQECPEVKVSCSACRKHMARREYPNHKSGGHCKPKTWFCQKCQTKMPTSEQAEHKKKCKEERKRCSRCGKYPLRDLWKDHWHRCDQFQCTNCQKFHPEAEREKHKEHCPTFKCQRCLKFFDISKKDLHPKECLHCRCSRCGKAVLETEKEQHDEKCDKWRCWRCGKFFGISNKDEHERSCNFTQCHHCSRRMEKSEWMYHSKRCPRWACSWCFVRFPRDQEPKHRQECTWRRCSKCDRKFPKREFDDHCANCPRWKCPHCGESMPVGQRDRHLVDCDCHACLGCCRRGIAAEDWDSHRKECPYGWCGRCMTAKIDNLEEHRATCTLCWVCHQPSGPGSGHRCAFKRCPNCSRKISKQHMPDHILSCNPIKCRVCKLKFRDEAAKDSHECRGKPLDGRSVYKKRNTQRITRKRKGIDWLNAKYPKTEGMEKILRMWKNEPERILIGDFEYAAQMSRHLKEFATFQFALMNAQGDWIVEPTTINHGMTTGELGRKIYSTHEQMQEETHEMNDGALYAGIGSLKKFYGTDMSQPTRGKTWKEVGEEIEQYVQTHGRLQGFLEWGRTMGDWSLLEDGLKSVGKADLLPPPPDWTERPLCWWTSMRALLKEEAAGESLTLGRLFQDIFPEQSNLYEGWHDAGNDVLMTKKLIEVYFCRAEGKPVPGKIDFHFKPLAKEELTNEERELLADKYDEKQRQEADDEDDEDDPEHLDPEDLAEDPEIDEESGTVLPFEETFVAANGVRGHFENADDDENDDGECDDEE